MKKPILKPVFSPTTYLLGVKINPLSLQNCLSLVENWVNSIKQHQITTPNPEQIVLAQKDKEFRDIINQSDLAIPDGIGIVWAVWLLGRSTINLTRFSKRARNSQTGEFSLSRDANLRKSSQIHCLRDHHDTQTESAEIFSDRLTGTDLMVALCRLAAQKHWRVFLLGGENNVASQTAIKLKEQCNNEAMKQSNHQTINNQQLTISYYEGTNDISKETSKERQQTIAHINNFRPHLLFVAYGAPYQEKWIAHNLTSLKSVKVAVGVGGAFDYLSGQIKRAPSFIRQIGLEWLWRLLHEPWRWRRQLALIKFVGLVLKQKLFRY